MTAKLERPQSILTDWEKVAVAFSGETDSAFRCGLRKVKASGLTPFLTFVAKL